MRTEEPDRLEGSISKFSWVFTGIDDIGGSMADLTPTAILEKAQETKNEATEMMRTYPAMAALVDE